MKQTKEVRPGFALIKQTDDVSYFHMQMPRWLFSDAHYTDMPLAAKVAYTFLLNRFRLSRRNGWVNGYGEVYVIYTREDLAREMQISYRKAIACFKELAGKGLIWEQRQGRGLPNRIFLAQVQAEEKSAFSYDCAPFCPEPGSAESELPELSDALFQTCQNPMSADAETVLPDLPQPHTSKKEKREKENRNTEKDSSVTRVCAKDGREEIAAILQNCALERFTWEEAETFRDAVCWLYYCNQLRMDACTYPQSYVRETLWRLTPDALDYALDKLQRNENDTIRNSLAYTAKVIFGSIMEPGSDVLLDPVINHYKRKNGIL